MEKAFVCINCKSGSEKQIIKELNQLREVTEIYNTLGPYDILAKIESNSSDILKTIITNQIRKINNINSTVALFDIGKADSTLPDLIPDVIPDVIPEEKKPIEPPERREHENGEEEEEDEDDEDYDSGKSA